MYEQDTPRRATRGEQKRPESISSPISSEIAAIGNTVEWWLFGLLGLVAGLLALTAVISWNLSEGSSKDPQQLGVESTANADPASAEKNTFIRDQTDSSQSKSEKIADLQISIDEIVAVAPLAFDPLTNAVGSESENQVKMLAQVLEENPDRTLRIYSEPRLVGNDQALLSKAAQLKVALEGYGISSSQVDIDDETPERAVELQVE